MKLEARMAKFIKDEEKNQQDRKFHYRDIIFLENPEDYPDLILGKENPQKLFVSQSHFRGKEKSTAFYVPVFKIVDLEAGEDPRDFSIHYTSKKEAEETSLHYDEKHQIFFDMPKLSWNKDYEKYVYSNSLEKAVFGSVNAGVFYLNVYKGNSKLPVNRDYYKVCILPSSLPFSKYKEMIDDILHIRKELIIEQTAAKQSIQVAWEHTLEEMERVMDEIEHPLLQINKHPKVKLTETYEKVPIRSIKKFNAKTVMNLLLNQGNIQSTSVRPSESTDIYENQMIQHALTELKKYVEAFKTYYQKKLINEEAEMRKIAEQLPKRYGMDSLVKLERVIQTFHLNTSKQYLFQSMVKTLQTDSEPEEDTVEVKVHISVNHEYRCSMNFMNGKLITTFSNNILHHDGTYSFDYKSNRQRLTYSIAGDPQPIEIFGRRTELELQTADLSQHLFLYNHLKNMKKPAVITLHAVVKKNSYNDDDPLRGGRVKKPNSNEYYHNLYSYPLQIVELKGINGQATPAFEQPELQMKEYFTINGIFPLKDEVLEEINSLKKKTSNRKQQVQRFNTSNHQVERLLTKINRYLQLSLFDRVRPRNSNWRLTQIFINDKHYARVWKQLRNLDKTYEFTTDFQEEDLLVKKTDQLYEYWIFIVLIRQLTETGWKIIGNTTFKNLVNQFLSDNWTGQAAVLEEMTVQLEHPGKQYTAVTEDGRVDEESSCFIEKIKMTVYFNKYIGKKRPDYAFKLDVFLNQSGDKTQQTKWFYLDAKYRNYGDQGGVSAWYHDVNSVAINKYINFYNENNQPTNGSFIIHPDADRKYTYYGGYMNESMTKHLDDIKGQSDRNPCHQFGSFACTPGHTEHLKLFIRMMLEYHFASANTPFICFRCGSSDTRIMPKFIRSDNDNKKYHITCSHCDDFWVRTHCNSHGHMLIKHLHENYHKEEFDNYPWFVKCPACDVTDETIHE